MNLSMRRLPTVREYMDTSVPTLSPDTDILKAVSFLVQKGVTGAPVIDATGKLVGMLTELDCLKLLTHGDGGQGSPRGQVKDFMSTTVQTIPPDMDIYYAAGLFLKVHFRRFPVVEDGELVGAITRFDILKAVQRGLATL